MKFIENLNSFFKKNWINISFVVVALFLILAIVAIKNIEFKDHPNKELEKIIMYEKFRSQIYSSKTIKTKTFKFY